MKSRLLDIAAELEDIRDVLEAQPENSGLSVDEAAAVLPLADCAFSMIDKAIDITDGYEQ